MKYDVTNFAAEIGGMELSFPHQGLDFQNRLGNNNKSRIMKVFSFIVMALLGCSTVSAQQVSSSTVQRPKLVVCIVVDQMRWDYLYRYQKRYGEGGFKRLLNEGFSCENTRIPYVPSVTVVSYI